MRRPILAILLLAIFAFSAPAQAVAADNAALQGEAGRILVKDGEFQVDGRPIWINGANTPWIEWNDFGGHFDQAAWDHALQALAENRVNATRVWITCNGRTGVRIEDDGTITGMTPKFWRDVDELFEIAHEKRVYLMVALISFDHTEPRCYDRDGREVGCARAPANMTQDYQKWRAMYASPIKRQAFVDQFVIPFVNRYKENPYFWAIDIGNELDWNWDDNGHHYVSKDDTLDLIARSANAIHAHSRVLVTSGAGTGFKYLSPRYMGNLWSDASLSRYQPGAYLDFYKPHYYDWMNPHYGNPFEKRPGEGGYGLTDKPVVIGEVSASGTTGYSIGDIYERLLQNGYAGAMAWSSNGVDANGGMESMGFATRGIALVHPGLVYPSGTPRRPDLDAPRR